MTEKKVQETATALTSAVSRRSLLQWSAVATAGIAGSGLLAGCGSALSAVGGKPKRGGTMKVGVITGGTAETLNPGLVLSTPDGLRTYALFDRLFEQYDDVETLRPGLALAAESNHDATRWVLSLRPGVRWHDGKAFGADDVVWTVKSWGDPRSFANQFFAGIIDFSKVRRAGPLTVEIPLLSPAAEFPSLLTFYNMGVIQDGATSFARPIGTGPFKFSSFTPGQQSVFTANADYWNHPYPYVDELRIDSSFTDETPRVNALLSGVIDVLPLASPTIARSYVNSPLLTLLRSPSPINMLFSMRVDQGPFAEPRVRQALRLCVDRQAMVDIALGGFGQPSSDLLGYGCKYFAEDLVRGRDLEQARSLLKSAGAEGLTVNLPTANVAPGYVESATLFAQQASAIGVTVRVQSGAPSNYFGGDYLTRAIGQDQSLAAPSLTQHYRTFFALNGGYNTTHWGSQSGGAKAEAALAAAVATVDPARATEAWREVQLAQFRDGGQIAFARQDAIDLISPRVKGLQAGPFPTLNNWRLLTGWIAA